MCLQRVERNLTTEQQSSLCELSLIMFVCMQGPLPQPSYHSALRTPSHLASSVCVRHSMRCCFLWVVIPLVTGYLGWKGRKLYLSVSYFICLNELLWACPIFSFHFISYRSVSIQSVFPHPIHLYCSRFVKTYWQ